MASWTAYQTMPWWPGTLQQGQLVTSGWRRQPAVTAPTALLLPHLVQSQIWNVGHFTPSTSLLSMSAAAVTTAKLLILRQVLSYDTKPCLIEPLCLITGKQDWIICLNFIKRYDTVGILWPPPNIMMYVCLSLGPCSLDSVNATNECNSDIILVEWNKAASTSAYLVTAEADDKTLISCNSSSNSCALQGARCGMQYSVIVSASSDKCSSLRSPPIKITMGIFQFGYAV